MFKYLVTLIFFIPEVALAASVVIDKISVDKWLFGIIIAAIGYYVRSLVITLNKVVDQQVEISKILIRTEITSQNHDDRIARNEDYISTLRERSHDIATKMTVMINKKERT